MIHLDYRDARPIYTQITDAFRAQIAAGVLQKGDKLPSVRELAVQLSINPNTIQRAYREMESAGLIATIGGKGCFVCGSEDTEATLWQAFDTAAARLLQRGISPEALYDRLKQGGIYNAPNA